VQQGAGHRKINHGICRPAGHLGRASELGGQRRQIDPLCVDPQRAARIRGGLEFQPATDASSGEVQRDRLRQLCR
jgi:hypothetical protein